MRIPIALLVFALPLLAQERSEEPETKAAPTQEQIQEWVRQLSGKDAELRKAALDALTRQAQDDPRLVLEALNGLEGTQVDEVRVLDGIRDLRVFLTDSDSQEQMKGSWSENGRKGDYTLRSVGKGRYVLEATTTGENGSQSRIRDQGTLSELRQKYSFLQGLVFMELGEAQQPERIHMRPRIVRQPGSVGVSVQSTSEVLRYHLALPEGAGMVVEKVLPGTRAEQLGLKRFDILVRIDGTPIDTPEQIKALEGREGTLEYVRRGKTLELDLAAFPAPPEEQGVRLRFEK